MQNTDLTQKINVKSAYPIENIRKKLFYQQ